MNIIIKYLIVFGFIGLKANSYLMSDEVYDKKISTVLFYQNSSQLIDMFQPPIASLANAGNLVLKFDEIGDEYYNYYARIINCDAYWNKSTLPDNQFLSSYNEFRFNQYIYSSNTLEKYIHYTFNVPKVNVSGNYVLIIYRDGDIEDVVITRRFVIYENKINVGVSMGLGVGDKRFSHQVVDLVLSYPSFDVQNPNDLKVVIRQNGRWDNALLGVKPLYDRQVERMLDYRYFNNELAFSGGNEFRAFDTRSLMNNRLNISQIMTGNDSYEVFVMDDKVRSDQSYTLYPDVNGWYAILRQDTNDGMSDGDYCWVNFQLKSDQKLEQQIYLFGALTGWKIDPKYLLKYDEKDKAYKLRARFKQGYYNYEYVTKESSNGKANHALIEGDFSQSNNFYEVIVYYTPFGSRAEHVIGYRQIYMN